MYNLYTHIASNPGRCRRFTLGETLFTLFNCRLANKMEDLWSHHNYVVYVLEGRKIWHTSNGSYDLNKGDCVFVRKGACIVEQFFDTEFCFVLFFMPDEFICDVLKKKSTSVHNIVREVNPVIYIDANSAVQAYFQSMLAYFNDSREPDQSLLELKFRELILIIADNPVNNDMLSYFCLLLKQPQRLSLQRVMEENFYYNLKLEEFARLSSRSLSAFKRDFIKLFNTTPGKWLLEKRLDHANHLLSNLGKTVSEAAFESGFESASHFSRAFRSKFGTSPAAVRLQTTV